MSSTLANMKEINSLEQTSKIQRFYAGKVILVTGGTGFLGKVLIDKLLRTCPEVYHIYLLMREKNGMTAESRLEKLLEHELFSRLKKENKNFTQKLSVIHGDLLKPSLGMSQDDETMLSRNVDIVIHSAATLRFDEPLKSAIMTNLAATKQMCLHAERMVNLKAFVYVSTAFSNCENPIIPERVCEPPICPEKLISLIELFDDAILDDLTPSLLGAKPNTYVFTKCAAEKVVHSFRSTVPVAIIRPSIIVGTVAEPAPGWIDSLQAATGVVVSTLAGLMRTVVCDEEAPANIVPVDLTVNAIIALAHSVAQNRWLCSRDEEEDVPVINFVSTAKNSLKWREFRDLLNENVKLYPSGNTLWYPFVSTPQNPLSALVFRGLLHHLPANLIDFASAKCGRPTKLRKMYSHLDKFTSVINYFSTRHFAFEEANARILWEGLEPQDQRLFPFDMAAVQWEVYFPDYVKGCRQFLLKEDPSTIDKARVRVKILYLVHLLTKSSLFLLVLRVLWVVTTVLSQRIIK